MISKKSHPYFKNKKLNPDDIWAFQNIILSYYKDNKRSFSWRNTNDPYHILISEIMLQQTSTTRVKGKYEQFIKEFPDFNALAKAPLRQILFIWQGLGYNRRALALKTIAEVIEYQYNGELPSSPEILISLPGIGSYTASAIAALAFNRPTAFIETNVRTVFIHFFFESKKQIRDHEILPLVEKTLYRHNPREWYYALFDYGAMLKKQGNFNTASVHYRKQSPFRGSNRELRGKIMRLLLSHDFISEDKIAYYVNHSPQEIKHSLEQLEKEGFLSIAKGYVSIE